jgi:DNA-directed RNA polymerase specialized sigma24 family protein
VSGRLRAEEAAARPESSEPTAPEGPAGIPRLPRALRAHLTSPQDVVIVARLAALPIADIAGALHISPEAVRMRESRGAGHLAHVLTRLEPRGLEFLGMAVRRKPFAEIAETHRVSRECVVASLRNALRQLKRLAPPGAAPLALGEAVAAAVEPGESRAQRACAMRRAGATWSRIGTALGCSPAAARALVRRAAARKAPPPESKPPARPPPRSEN